MPLELKKTVIIFSESVTVDDAEKLFDTLIDHPTKSLNLSACEYLHTSVLQVILQCKPVIKLLPKNNEYSDFLHDCAPQLIKGDE